MIIRDNTGKIIGQIEHLRDSDGNAIDSNTVIQNGWVVSQTISICDKSGRVQTRTVQNGRLLP